MNYQGYPYPPVPPQRPRRWFFRQTRLAQVLLCCAVIFVALVLCGYSASLVAAGPTESTATPTATSAPVVQRAATQAPTHVVATRLPSPVPTHKPTPHMQPTPKPRPTQAVCHGVNGNPWCYSFTPGRLISNSPSSFCSYFACIASFWNGRSYVIECQDSDYSKSGGIRGSCSHHGGDRRALYAH